MQGCVPLRNKESKSSIMQHISEIAEGLGLNGDSFLDLSAIEDGVEISVDTSSGSNAVHIEGDTCQRLVDVSGEIKDLQSEQAILKDAILKSGKTQFFANNGNAMTPDDLDTQVSACDDTGTEVKVIAQRQVKPIPMLTTAGKPSKGAAVVNKVFGDNTHKYYDTINQVSFSIEQLPVEDRERIIAYLNKVGVPIKRVLVPHPELHLVGRIPAGQDSNVSPTQQMKLEDALGSRVWSVRTK
jgi:hypothetical protein